MANQHYIYGNPNTSAVYVAKLNADFYLYSQSSIIPDIQDIPDITGSPSAILGFLYDGNNNKQPLSSEDLGYSYGVDPYDINCYDNYITWQWAGPNFSLKEVRESYPALYMLYNVGQPNNSGMNPSGGLNEGFSGPYALRHHPVESGLYYHERFNVEPFSVTSYSGTGSTFGAKTIYASGSHAYDVWGITSIEFSSGNAPRIEFTDTTARSQWQTGGQWNSFGIIVATGTRPEYSYDERFYDLSDGMLYTMENETVFGNVIINPVPYRSGEPRQDLLDSFLADVEERASVETLNNYHFLQLIPIGGFIDSQCGSGSTPNIQNPVIFRLDDLTEIKPEHAENVGLLQATGILPVICGEYSYTIKGVNAAGQGPYLAEEDLTTERLSTYTFGWTSFNANNAGFSDGNINYITTCPPTTNPWYHPTDGTTWTLLSVTGVVSTMFGDETYLIWNGPGEIVGGGGSSWRYVKSIKETWRVSGPSGDSFCYSFNEVCGYPWVANTQNLYQG